MNSAARPPNRTADAAGRSTHVGLLKEWLEDEGYGPILREEGYETDVPDEALLVPAEPAEVAG